MTPGLQELLIKIEHKLGWGASASWQSRDFENLNQQILNETGVSLSASTLRRIFGKVEYNHLPSTTTLDTLAKFAGHTSWRAFQKSTTSVIAQEAPLSISKEGERRNAKTIWIAAGVLAMILLAVLVVIYRDKKDTPKGVVEYSFTSEPLTRSIPNSVIFKYDASSAPSDSVYIQQSWDERTRVKVNKQLHTFTSVYYEPGFYQAKLIVDGVVVKEHRLLIPSDGWLGMIDNKPVPVYLKPDEFMRPDVARTNIADIEKNNIAMQPRPPVVKYYNVGNFDSVSVSDFSFTTYVRNDYREGSAACQFTYIYLITDAAPIVIPLSAKGCVSELFLLGVDHMVHGKNEDLSAFGVDFGDWIKVTCKSDSGNLRYLVNDNEVYNCPLPEHPVHIIGLGYYFAGTGSIQKVSLSHDEKEVFRSF